jgi:hypothetical protein
VKNRVLQEHHACQESAQPETEDVSSEEQDQNNTIIDPPQPVNDMENDNDQEHHDTGHESPVPIEDDGPPLLPSYPLSVMYSLFYVV